ncbi:hypothetical protein, partial [Nocardia veterana]|uniref:hypothetical protein n=1 Tax=Nocardia veterana TaxID=132249 RepID=UPI001FDF13B8
VPQITGHDELTASQESSFRVVADLARAYGAIAAGGAHDDHRCRARLRRSYRTVVRPGGDPGGM